MQTLVSAIQSVPLSVERTLIVAGEASLEVRTVDDRHFVRGEGVGRTATEASRAQAGLTLLLPRALTVVLGNSETDREEHQATKQDGEEDEEDRRSGRAIVA